MLKVHCTHIRGRTMENVMGSVKIIKIVARREDKRFILRRPLGI
tara:strand:- start:20 stop:151 length:132 start_codon:yes stop_codon:yes gene_type:complete